MDTNNMKTICYWPDGYYVDDTGEAELLDLVNAFGAAHEKIELAPDADIQAEVDKLVGIDKAA